jgi:hypothetical protein
MLCPGDADNRSLASSSSTDEMSAEWLSSSLEWSDELLLPAKQSEASSPAADDGGVGDDAEYDEDAEDGDDEDEDEEDERRGWSPFVLLLSNCDDD